ncbi:hypothetical protein CVT25_011274 [Psilocybe cyanescens]|uniref:arginine--tRNA ligase n=1 Tax=Psilocybe cyanescens TaxID=93625 RepID=A0A409XCB4_PSICY|nr:hypothetical protein CVT25_011274 [Psilocybe cyanescens]
MSKDSNLSKTSPPQPVLDSFKLSIAKRLSETLPLTIEQAFDGVDYGKKGEDFTVALPRFRLPGSISENASKVIEGFTSDEWIESIVADKSFLHFRVNTVNMISKVLNQVNTLSHASTEGQYEYGCNDSGKGKRVVVEYSSPNIVKAFHIGHLRSTIIGAFLANLFRACGWDVVSMNYLGDWGTQFGVVARGYAKFGSQEEFDKNPLMHLCDVYIKSSKEIKENPQVQAEAAKLFKLMEDGDDEMLSKWNTWREISMKKYQQVYNQLNIKFDIYTGESEVTQDSMGKALARLESLSLISDREGAKYIDLSEWSLMSPVLRKTDGTSMYLTRDIGAAFHRHEKYNFDKMIYVVSTEQVLHFKQLFKVLELMDTPWAKDLEHISYGMILGVSTRKGTAVFLDQIIKQAGDAMHAQMLKNEEKYAAVDNPEATSLEIAMTGIKIQDMAAKRANDYTFNWNRMLSFEGDTGPYLQYAHARLASIGRKNPHLLPLPPTSQISTHTLAQYPHAREIVFLLGTYPDVIKVAMKTQEPSGVVTYAFKLAHVISSAWDSVIVKGEEDLDKARAKLYLYSCAKEVLAASMRLLTIRPLDRI